ncbi:MAG: hypothetical protein M3011_05260 [Actinomycetota bacterium]|nr:hypothetical protein [Actinomycetota bacterium]
MLVVLVAWRTPGGLVFLAEVPAFVGFDAVFPVGLDFVLPVPFLYGADTGAGVFRADP